MCVAHWRCNQGYSWPTRPGQGTGAPVDNSHRDHARAGITGSEYLDIMPKNDKDIHAQKGDMKHGLTELLRHVGCLDCAVLMFNELPRTPRLSNAQALLFGHGVYGCYCPPLCRLSLGSTGPQQHLLLCEQSVNDCNGLTHGTYHPRPYQYDRDV